MGEVLILRGHHLSGDQVAARFTHVRSSQTLDLTAAAGATSTGCSVQLPPDPPAVPVAPGSPLNPDNWQAGVYAVAAVVTRAGKPSRVSNELPVAVAPAITSINVVVNAGAATFTVTASPKVWRTQRAVLVIADREIAAAPIAVEKTDTLTFAASGLPSGEQWVRLRVDGVESILVDRSAAPPAFISSQKVTIP